MQEVLQGQRDGPESDAVRQAILTMPILSDPLTLDTFLEAAETYRIGRRKGYSVDMSVDTAR